jgi:predicted N-acyltransferase
MKPSAPVRFHAGMAGLDGTAWNRLVGDYPFLRYEFLAALEDTGCVTPANGWSPHHLQIGTLEQPLVLAPMYEKAHSWGEFVFDFAWARAWESRGLEYYPKLLLAIPFTPATGPRLLCADSGTPEGAAHRLAALAAIEADARSRGRSSAHALFIDEPLRAAASEAGWLLRRDCHFQWHNRGYADFADFLASFSAEKRKKARRERRRIAEQGIEFETRTGTTLDRATLKRIDQLHAATFMRHGHQPYLNGEFFQRVAAALGEAFIAVLARRERALVAMAVYFRSSDTLYGRYWGATADFHSLHFEACYHQGIEYCIRNGLQRFEPGTQGEHKLARGFEPTLTWSAHWLADRDFRLAVARYLGREAAAVAAYAEDAARHTPFRA